MTLLDSTLALLLVVVLASYALPTYREYVARGHRQLAIDALHAMALDIEMGGGYGGARANVSADEGDTAAIAAAREWVPSAGRPIYRLRIEPGSGGPASSPFYIITAEPVIDGPQGQDRCGVFFLDASGLRGNRARRGGSLENILDMPGCWQGR